MSPLMIFVKSDMFPSGFKVGSGRSSPWLLELLGHQLHHSNDIDPVAEQETQRLRRHSEFTLLAGLGVPE